MMRRFVYLVAEKCNYKSRMCSYSLHPLDVSKHLFYDPSAAKADAAPTPPPRPERLPPPCISFLPSPYSMGMADLPLFPLVSPGNRVVTCDNLGHTVLYDADSNSVQIMLSIKGFIGAMPTIVFTEDDVLYVLVHSGFHVLRRHNNDATWHWESLPWPPIDRGHVRSHTVIHGGRTICLSSDPGGFGTYCFDTVDREWWRWHI